MICYLFSCSTLIILAVTSQIADLHLLLQSIFIASSIPVTNYKPVAA